MDLFCEAETKLNNQIICRTEHFILFHDGYPLSLGHLILIPKKHRECFLDLASGEEKEFIETKAKVIAFLRKNFRHPVMFEHGAIAQTVPHAHLHFLPTDRSIRTEIGNIAVRTDRHEKPYLYYEDGQGATYYRVEKSITPGFLHTTFARVLGRSVNGPDRADKAGEWTLEIKKLWNR